METDLPMWLSGESKAASVGVRTTSAPRALRVASFSWDVIRKESRGREGSAHERHLVRHSDDHGITLVSAVFSDRRLCRRDSTLTAQAMARPMPVKK
jgi:hypothetical protein